MKHFTLKIKPCPPGHTLHIAGRQDECECGCNTGDQNIANCFPDENKIILEVAIANNHFLFHDHYIYVTDTHRKVFGLIM